MGSQLTYLCNNNRTINNRRRRVLSTIQEEKIFKPGSLLPWRSPPIVALIAYLDYIL